MVRRCRTVAAASVALVLVLAGCGSPSSQNRSGTGDTGRITTQQSAMDPNAKGPAPEVAGAQKGGTLTVYAQAVPMSFDPTDTYDVDAQAIEKLIFRSPTQYALRNGKAVLVPDLTDLGTVSPDKLTWTFAMKPGIRYDDGTDVKVDDLAYAIKRSFARDVFPGGPTYQLSYFKDGDKYQGPYAGGDSFAGVETQGTDKLLIHLAKPFADLPFFMSFPMFTPIPQAKDTKQDYQNRPLATGPYVFSEYVAGSSLTLKKNPHWDPNTDPVRHQYLDGWNFRWGGDAVSTQQRVLNSAGADAGAMQAEQIDSSLIPQITGSDQPVQLVRGQSPCVNVLNIDTRKIPDINVRKAIAKAINWDALSKASGNNPYTAEPASSFLSPTVQGYEDYPPYPDLTGAGAGDPEGAKKILSDAGKLGFELSWYYTNSVPLAQQRSAMRADDLTKAGFKVKAIGVSAADIRARASDYDAPVNLDQAPRGWCSDWPTGSSWIPTLFQSRSVAEGNSWGMQQDSALDAEIEAAAALPTDEAAGKWAELDQKIMSRYVALPWFYNKTAFLVGTKVGGAEADPTQGQPSYVGMFLRQ